MTVPSTVAPEAAAPAEAAVPAAPAAQPPAEKKPAKDDSAAVEADSALLTVSVPEDAVVVVNGFQTKAIGLVRQFKSSGLKPGLVYNYEVQVTYNVDGAERTESKSIKLRSILPKDILQPKSVITHFPKRDLNFDGETSSRSDWIPPERLNITTRLYPPKARKPHTSVLCVDQLSAP